MSSLSGRDGPRYKHTASDTGPYETISVEKLTPIIGAEITGVDLGKLVSDNRPNRQIDEIHRALAARQRRGLAFRRVLRRRAADGLDPLHQAVAAAGRRHAVCQHVCRL
jgi:hypothetical protein